MTGQREVWLRGPLPGVSPALQPVAHALLQAREDVARTMSDFPGELLWERPAGVASVGFHLQHLCGVIDRLFTYARGESLSDAQMAALRAEGDPPSDGGGVSDLVQAFEDRVDRAVEELRGWDPSVLHEAREVGRARLPSTVLGLLFHAAEHSQRHYGQLLVTSRVLRGGR